MMASGAQDEADQALASGDLKRAIDLLEASAAQGSDEPALWLKLAALYRGTGDLQRSLESVHRALALAPLDFAALLMRASLLQRLGNPEAGEAWGNALAQRPPNPPPEMLQAISQAEVHHASWLDARERRMKQAMGRAEAQAGEDERARIERFRSNVLRRTKPYHSSPTHYHFPGLPEYEFHPRSLFPWIEKVESATDDIASEFEAVMKAERAELVPYIQYEDHLPMHQWKPLNRNPDWTAIHLIEMGKVIAANAAHCPRTLELLKSLPQPDVPGASPNAMFSLLAPHTAIPPHVGISNTRLVCHLPIVVPEGCWFRVGAETRHWKRGEAFVFDDTIEHEALNPSDQLRVVFIFDIWTPQLSPPEREAVSALIGDSRSGPGGL